MGRIEQVTGPTASTSRLHSKEAAIEHLAATILEQETARTQFSHLLRSGKRGQRRPVFSFLHAISTGGGFYCQKNLARGLGDDPAVPMQFKAPRTGMGARIPSTIEAMAESQPARRFGEFAAEGRTC